MKKLKNQYLILAVCFFLKSCATNKQSVGTPSQQQWQHHQYQVKNITQYQIRGAFAYITDRKKIYSRFFWQQTQPQHYRLLLLNPIGGTEMELNVTPQAAQLTNNEGKQYVSHNAQSLIQQLTDMRIPLDNLHQWILGLPGEANDIQLNNHSLLQNVVYSQGGLTWKVNYLKYDTQIQPPLPGQIEIVEGEQRIKLKIDNWILQP